MRTTKGAAIVIAKPVKVSFHQVLNDQNCVACPSDHAGPKLTKRSRKPFSHAMLRVAARDRCQVPTAVKFQATHREEGVSQSLDKRVWCLRRASGEGEVKGGRKVTGRLSVRCAR